MKRLLSTVILLILALTLFAFDYSYKGVDFKCKITNKGVCITGFSVKAKNVVIPSVISYRGLEYKVQSVSTFLNGVNYLTETLVLEEGIEDIDKFSFNEFRKLVSVTLPSSLRHIGRNAFRNNSDMKFHLASNISETMLRNGKDFNPTPVANSASDTSNSRLIAQSKPSQNPVVNYPTPQPAKPFAPQPQRTQEKAVDVDMDIPLTTVKNADTYCVIIANEKYEDIPEVAYASRDGEIFKEYCIKTLGIPAKQIKTFIDASYTDIKRAMNWVETIDNVTEGNSRIIFYYAGHGLPSENDKNAYLIPTDGFPKDITTCYKLSELYSRLGKLKSQSVTVFLDACFSGVERGSSQALIAARGVAIKPKKEVLSGNIVVFSATSDDETALSYQEKRHGMFTYYLLNELKKSKGNINYGDLYRSVSSQVKKNSILENDKLQTPSVNCSANMKEKWQDLQF